MRIQILYPILVVFATTSVFGQCDKTGEFIPWVKHTKLKYEDFTGAQDTTFLVYGYPANGAAMTKIETIFNVNENNELTFSVVNKFLKQKSWIMNQTVAVLSHEQGHFDISEIYARKIRKALTELLEKDVTEEAILIKTVNSSLNELAIYQNRYDEETHHGFILEKQKNWEGLIQNELEQLRSFE